MRVFVAGATGAIGRPLVRRLLDAGHEVTGLTRSPEKARALEAAGASAAVADAHDAAALRQAVLDARPEVVVNQLTDLPRTYDVRRYAKLLEGTSRLRATATPTLAAAARDAGARRLISQSVAFMYAPTGGPIKSEEDPLRPAEGPTGATVAALRVLEEATMTAEGLEGVVLRYGWFYGPGTYYARDGSIAADVRRRRFPIVGNGDGIFSYIHVDDAAAATVAALDGPPGIYNIVDDDPAPTREWLPVYAAALGAKPPRRVPVWLARLIAGPVAADIESLRGASNAKARRELGWAPAWPSWRQGFAASLEQPAPAHA